jgi:hypothetical protein
LKLIPIDVFLRGRGEGNEGRRRWLTFDGSDIVNSYSFEFGFRWKEEMENCVEKKEASELKFQFRLDFPDHRLTFDFRHVVTS